MNTSNQMVEHIDWRSSLKARMTELTMSDESQLGLHPVFCQRDVPD